MSRKRGNRPTTRSQIAASQPQVPGAGVDADVLLRRVIWRTSETIWLTGVPALFFIAIVAVFSSRDPTLRAGLTTQAIDALLSKWLYFSYFSVTSILAYNIFEDYGYEFKKRRYLWGIYIIVFLSLANTLIAALLEEAAAWKNGGGPPVTATATMALSYALSIVGLFGYSLFREADLALRGQGLSSADSPTSVRPTVAMGEKIAGILHSVKRYWVPALMTVILTLVFDFGLKSESIVAYFLSTLFMISGVTFPIYMHFVKP